MADAGYMQISFASLKAITTSTVLTFTYKNVPGAFFLDDVAVVPASEPATLAIAGSGLIAVWLLAGRLRPAVLRSSRPLRTRVRAAVLANLQLQTMADSPEAPSRFEPV